jgi:hypothetical protein
MTLVIGAALGEAPDFGAPTAVKGGKEMVQIEA